MKKLLLLVFCLFPWVSWGLGVEEDCAHTCYYDGDCNAGGFCLEDADGCLSCCTPTSSTFTRWIVPDDNTNRYKFPIRCRRAVMNADGTTCACAEYEYKYACESTYYWDGQNCVRCPHVNVGDSNSYGKNSAGCNIELTTGTAKCLYEVSDAVKGMDKCYLSKLTAAGQQYSDATGTFEVMDECHNYQ